MKSLGIAIVMLLTASAQLWAEDAAQPLQVSKSWNGAYLGLYAAYVGGDVSDYYDLDTLFSFDLSGGGVGILLGQNFQRGDVVYGYELDYARPSADGLGLCTAGTRPRCFGSGTEASTSLDQTAALKARLGYSFDGVMVFGMVGYSMADLTITDRLQSGSDSHRHRGPSFGGGIEWELGESTNLRLDYTHTTYDEIDYALVTSPDRIGFDLDQIRAALIWRF